MADGTPAGRSHGDLETRVRRAFGAVGPADHALVVGDRSEDGAGGEVDRGRGADDDARRRVVREAHRSHTRRSRAMVATATALVVAASVVGGVVASQRRAATSSSAATSTRPAKRPSASSGASSTAAGAPSCARVRVDDGAPSCFGRLGSASSAAQEGETVLGDLGAVGAEGRFSATTSSTGAAVLRAAAAADPPWLVTMRPGQHLTVELPVASRTAAWTAPAVLGSQPPGLLAGRAQRQVVGGRSVGTFVSTRRGVAVLGATLLATCGVASGPCGTPLATWVLVVVVDGL